MADFDAYYKWLGIPPEEQPPHHYRLLGIKPLESDPDVIESAADQRMVHLRSFQAGKNGPLSQKLLNEVAAARGVLLDAKKKRAYDAELTQKLAATRLATRPIAQAIPLPEPGIEPSRAALPDRVVVRTAPTRKPNAGLPLLLVGVGGTLAALILVVVVVAALQSPEQVASGPRPVTRAPSTPGSPDIPAADGDSIARGSPVAPPPAVTHVEERPPRQPESAESNAAPAPIDVPKAEPPTDGAANPDPELDDDLSPTGPARPAVEAATGEPVDLFASMDTATSKVRGDWRFDGRDLVLRGDASKSSLVQIPYDPPAEYDLHLAAEREEGVFAVGVVVESQPLVLGFDFQLGNRFVTGVWGIDGKQPWSRRPRYGQRVLTGSDADAITIRVRRHAVQIVRNDQVLIDWPTDFSRYELPAECQAPNPRQMFLHSRGSCRVSRLAITPVGSVTTAARPEPAPAIAASAISRSRVPSDADQAPVKAKLADIYAAAPKKTSAEKTQLAVEMFALAKETKNKIVERYLLLRGAQHWALEAVNPRLAIEATDALAAEFDIDSAAERQQAVVALARNAKDNTSIALVLEESLPLVERTAAEQQFESAQKMLEALARLAQRPAGRTYMPRIAEMRASAAVAAKVARQLEIVRDKLQADPDDADANFELGKWLCLTAGDWSAGLPHLAKGSDPAIKACAERELKSPPASPDEQVAVADAWWEAAEQAPKEWRPALQSRAAHWYALAQPGVNSGLAKAKIDKRLAEAKESAAGLATPNLAGGKAGKGVLIVMGFNQQERNLARQACERLDLPFEESKSFDMRRSDYSEFHTILCGSNDMDYWGRDEARAPEAFQHVERFVHEGGHLIVLGSFNGRNCHHLTRFGIHTGNRHASTFESAGPATDLFFLGAESHVPSSGKMRSAGHFWCTRQHDVLLRVGPGPRQGDPAIVSVPSSRGRVTFTLCEPHWQNDWWLIDVMLGWVARGAPLPKS